MYRYIVPPSYCNAQGQSAIAGNPRALHVLFNLPHVGSNFHMDVPGTSVGCRPAAITALIAYFIHVEATACMTFRRGPD